MKQRICKAFCLVILAASVAGTSSALELTLSDDVTANLDSTVSLGIAVRVADRDKELVGAANGGSFNSINYDNGNLNYDSGEVFSAPIKLTQELNVDIGDNARFFSRWFVFYDTAIMDQDTARSPLGKSAENELGQDFELLDAIIAVDLEIGERILTVKAGNMVLNWGESIFIQNGINEINPVRIPALRLAGAELREALIPVATLDLNVEISDVLSAEAFYQFESDNTIIEPEGTFFSVNDFASPGGEYVFLGFGRAPPLGPPDSAAVYGQGVAAPVGAAVQRGADRDADDQGQFGVALRYLAEDLNNTEFGFYWTHLHSRLPLLSARTAGPDSLAAGDFAAGAEYFAEYPEDLDTLGISFNTLAGEVSLAGEFAYHIDRPLQIDEVEILYAALSPIDLASGTPVFSRGQLGQKNFGDTVEGYKEKDVIQWGCNAVRFFNDVAGSDRLTVLAEVGATYVADMESKDELRYNGLGTDSGGGEFFTAAGIQPETQVDGYADDFSWGYRLVAKADYSNAIGAVGLAPSLAFRHDVSGTSPGPGGNFIEDRKQVTLKLAALYQQNLQAAVSYTNYFDGDEFNQLSDRDFVAVSTSYSF